ncbi:MAG: ABC transporter substrate-binding protein [Planctomycetes bacterium]|nr:ABC transporter substrate-binding protein [Planctomycetota bacterium]
MDRRTLGTALGALTIAAGSAWAAWGGAIDPPGRKGNPWTPGVPSAARYGSARRIVSVNLGVDEILLSLLPPGRIAALTRLVDDPTISNVTDLARAVTDRVPQMDAERILALEPDLLIAPPYARREVLGQLEDAGVEILRIPDCWTVDDIRTHLRFLGEALGVPDRAEELVREMDGVLEGVRARTEGRARPRVLFVGMNGDTMGKGTNFDLFVEAAGGINLAAEALIEGRKAIPVEQALALDPDVILVSGYLGDRKARGMEARPDLADDPAWREAAAVRAGRVHVLSGANLLSTSHYVTRTAEEIARILHPECYAP